MRDLFFVGFMLLLFLLAFKRPFYAVLAYLWVDLLQPQEQSYYLINTIPISLIAAFLAIAFWAFGEKRKQVRVDILQALMVLIFLWITVTTFNAMLPEHAWTKWDSAWKALFFAVFLANAVRTRQQIELTMLVITICVGALTISGGAKTALGGGGYGNLEVLVSRDVGLFESSTLATICVVLIPIVIYLYRHNQIVPKSRLTLLISLGLVASAVLTIIGSEARTGLVCLAAAFLLTVLTVKRRVPILIVTVLAVVLALPFAPQSWQERMGTIETYDEDQSASARLAVWGWTLDFAKENPLLGGGFGVWRTNTIKVTLYERSGGEGNERVTSQVIDDKARGFHNSYFEMLGEHGVPGLVLYLLLLGATIAKLLQIQRAVRGDAELAWAGAAARAMNHAVIIYLVGSIFGALAFQTTLYYFIALTAALSRYVAVATGDRENIRKLAGGRPFAALTANAR